MQKVRARFATRGFCINNLQIVRRRVSACTNGGPSSFAFHLTARVFRHAIGFLSWSNSAPPKNLFRLETKASAQQAKH